MPRAPLPRLGRGPGPASDAGRRAATRPQALLLPLLLLAATSVLLAAPAAVQGADSDPGGRWRQAMLNDSR